jgi:hypothetical protein
MRSIKGGTVVDRRGLDEENATTMKENRPNLRRSKPAKARGDRFGRLFAGLVTALAFLMIPSSAAQATDPGFSALEAFSSTTVAGAHPNVKVRMVINLDEPFGPCAATSSCLATRTFSLHWPTGFIGNPHVAPKCTMAEFVAGACPPDSQIGTVTGVVPGIGEVIAPLYNMETRPDQAGALGYLLPLVASPILIELTSRTDSDYGLDAVTSPQVRLLQLPEVLAELWGVPASPTHTPFRFATPLSGFGACLPLFTPGVEGCPPGTGFGFTSPTYQKPNSPERPFLQNPTTCGVDLTFSADVEYFTGEVGHAETPWPATTGCAQASFEPSLTGSSTTAATDTPSGLDTILKVPQLQSPQTPSPSELRTSVVTLPEGFTINPNAADGKVACPDPLTAIGTLGPATCPEFSKVATVTLDVAALPGPIPGALYIMEPTPGDRYRLLLAADGFATHVKLLGSVRPDPTTGRVSIVFEDLPQAPLQEFNIHTFGSERGLFATPVRCGLYPLEGEFVPWNTALVTRKTVSFMELTSGPGGSPCPGDRRPFGPSLRGGSSNGTAGKHAPFSLSITRGDGDQGLDRLNITTPPGFSATLRGVPYCPEQSIAALNNPARSGATEQVSPACPAASQIGTAVSGAGAGNHPLYTPGKVYLAGPYKGSPLSLVVTVPAVSGPYDLGNVVVRVAISVDPTTAQITAIADPLPRILAGIPLRLRSILINLDRQAFTLNPTNCDPSKVSAEVVGDEGAIASPSSLYQSANCADLGFDPKLSLNLRGGVKRRGHPALSAVLRTAPGEANLRKVVVAMPKEEFLDNKNIGSVCTRVQYAADACPANSIYGSATAVTPLLDEPLSGPVYLRSSSGDLPDLVVALKGQFDIDLVGQIDSTREGGLRTTFASVPDAPVSSFALNLLGGRKGLLINSKSLCKEARKASVTMIGQSDARISRKVTLKAGCGSKRKAKRQQRRAGAKGGR